MVFDIWQKLPTRYSDFENFYQKNKISISKKIGIEPIVIEDEQKNKEEITQFDLFYCILNNIDLPTEIDDFWTSFENSLFYLDDQTINYYFGKELDDINDLRLDSLYAHELLRECFCEWIKSIKIDKNLENNYVFNNSLFINFNYTDTLVNYFNICPNNIIHIHGKAKDKSSVIFGHGQKMTKPDDFMLYLGQRYKGLYAILNLLFKFYKKPNIQWRQVMQRLTNKQATLSNVKTVFVLGHSLGKADYYYFKELIKILPQDTKWVFSYYSEKDKLAIYELQKVLKFVNYELHDSIESILARFKVNN